MARIDLETFEKQNKERNNLHDKVVAKYTTFELAGEKYFQIDTYGKADREIPGKISQSLQFDKESAKEIVELLVNYYGWSLKLR